MPSWFRCCRADQHVAVQSQASSSAFPNNHRQQKSSKAALITTTGDRAFEDDKHAVQRWREQHEQFLPHSEEEKKEIEPANNEDYYYVDSSSPASSFGVDETNQPVKISPRAVQAWQQKQQKQQQQQQQAQEQFAATAETPPMISANHSLDGTASLHSEPKPNRPTRSKPPRTVPPVIKHVDDELAVAALVTPEPSPSFGSSPARSTSSSHFSRPSPQRSPLLRASSSPPHLPPSYSNNSSTKNSASNSSRRHHHYHHDHQQQQQQQTQKHFNNNQRQHDHDGFADALIREAALGKTAIQPTRSSSYSSSDADHERIKGQVFLQVSAQDAISPRSSIDENSATGSYSYYDEDTATLSDILTEPLSEVPSFVDSDTRERYILACRLLKTRMLQKSPPPILPMERELLQDLLYRFQSSRDAGSDVAFEALSNILQRENDPTVYSHSGSKDVDSDENMEEHDNDDLVGAHARSTSQDLSIREEEEGFNAVLRSRRQLQQQYFQEEKSSKSVLSSVSDDNKAKLPVEQPTSSLVRFDGWSEHVLKDQSYPFEIMGFSRDTPLETRVLTPALMEALRGFFPYAVSEDNFWLKFSLVRDGASVRSLLDKVKMSKHTILCIETDDGGVFGAFCSTPWRVQDQKHWFGTGESFLWRLKQSRYTSNDTQSSRIPNNEMEVYPFTGNDDMVQYCTNSTLAVGGGAWIVPCPYPEEPRGIGLLVDGDLEGGETNSCATFANPRLYGRTTSSNEFTIRNLEVWTLTPCLTVPLAEQLEQQKYFLEVNSRLSPSPPTRLPVQR